MSNLNLKRGARRLSGVLLALLWIALFLRFLSRAGSVSYLRDDELLFLVALPIVYAAGHFAVEWALRGFFLPRH